jgi:rhodanese-related sulfurtransferase
MNAWLIALLSLLALATLLTAAYIWTIRPPTPYTEEEARSGIHYNTIDHVIDVRGQEEWAAGHYSGAFHLPLKQLVSSLPQTFHDRSKVLLFYGDPEKSYKATRIAQDLGYTRVGYLVQGSYKGFEHRDPPIRHEM